jgi:hypothetical protein
MKNYIANENIDRLNNGDEMHTSSKLLRDLFRRSIEMGREYANNGDEATLFEAFRLMGTGLHCLEDFSAHSNYTELALIEMGEEGTFPHVGANTRVNVQGKDIWPLVTGTFGGVDFLHSVIGEVSDKAMQSEMSRLEGQISAAEQAAQNEGSDGILQRITDLIGKIPNLNSGDEMSQAEELKRKSQEQKESGQPWGVGDSADGVIREIMPYLEFHDKLMRKIEATGIGIITEKLAEVTTLFVFSLIAPWLLPILRQVSSELKTGSSEVIASSENAQHVVFNDDDSSNPTHSMLSKDHFSNVLNEPAGKIASAVLKFAVPLLMEAWDDEGVDINNTIETIINGVFHHPALRDSDRPGQEGRQAMFQVVEEWWNNKSSSEQDTLREQLSREGVQAGKNHVENAMTAQYGHGCGAPMYPTSQPKTKGEAFGQLFGGAVENALTGGGKSAPTGMGGLLGGILGGVAENMLGENRGGSSERTQYGRVGDTYDSYGGNQRSQDNYGQESSGYGGNNYGRNEESSYGGYGRSEEQSYGGYGGNQESSYGRREERYDAPAEDSYETEGYGGESRGYGGGESRSYYGGNNEGTKHASHKTTRDSDERNKRTTTTDTLGAGRKDYEVRGAAAGYGMSMGKGGNTGKGYQYDDDRKFNESFDKNKQYGREEKKSYGKRDEDEDRDRNKSKSSYGGGYGGSSGAGAYGSGSYGGNKRDEDDEEKKQKQKKYGKDDEEEKKQKKYGRDDDDDDRKQSSYSRDDDEKKNKKYSRDDDEDDKKKKKYGRDDDDDEDKKKKKYGRDDDDDDRKKSYKKHDNDDDDDRKKSYGHRKDDDDDDDRKRSYKKHDNDDDDDRKKSYGHRKDDDDDDDRKKSYKKHDNDDDDDRKKSYGHRKDDDGDDDRKKSYGHGRRDSGEERRRRYD